MNGFLRRPSTWVILGLGLLLGPAATLQAQPVLPSGMAALPTGVAPASLPPAWIAQDAARPDAVPLPQLPQPAQGGPAQANLARSHAGSGDQDPSNPGYVERRLLVRFAPGTSAADKAALHARYGAQVIRDIPQIGLQVLQFTSDDALAMVSVYQAQGTVRYAEPDYIAQIPETELLNRQLGGNPPFQFRAENPGPDAPPAGAGLTAKPGTWLFGEAAGHESAAPLAPFGLNVIPNDPLYSQQWHHAKINSPQAWDTAKADGVTIAIVDTGSTCNHPDLNGKCVAGYDFVNSDSNPVDDQGHGTHVSGIAAALTNNGIGGAGVAWEAKVMPVKALGAGGTGSHSDIANAIVWAADQHADVINMSLGGQFTSNALRDAVAYAIRANVVVVAAAGNDNTSNPSYPANYPGVIGVAATTQSDTKASFSNYGSYVDIAAPGQAILSTVMGGSYQAWNGTSMASPVVAGVVGLLKGINRSLTPAQVQQILEETADDLGSPGRDNIFGAGRVNAARAVARAAGGNFPTASPTANNGTPVRPAATATPTPIRPPGPTATPASDWIQQVEDLINRERANNGLGPLATNAALRSAAGRQATDLGAGGRCGHDGSDGSSPYDRMRDAGYSAPYGEIVACGQTSPAAAVAAWMNSSGHRAIILCTSCTEFGAGLRQNTTVYRLYWVVNFGSRRVTAPTPTLPRQATQAPATATRVPPSATAAPATPTSLPGTTDVALPPGNNRIGWVVSSQPNSNHFDDVDTFTGAMNNLIYHGAMQMDLDSIPAGAFINFARFEMIGRDSRYLGSGGTWAVRILAGAIDPGFATSGYSPIHNAAVADTLLPLLGHEDLAAGRTNIFNFTSSQVMLLQDRLGGSKKISFRMDGPTVDALSNLFTWDTGVGPDSHFRGPRLVVNYSLNRPDPRPTLTATEPPPPSATPLPPTVGPSPTPSLTPVPATATATAPPPPASATPTSTLPAPAPTADLGDTAIEIRPAAAEDVGWVRQMENRNHFGDINTFTGFYLGFIYRGAVQFDLSAIPQGVGIRSARLTLIGYNGRYLSSQGNGQWQVQMLGAQSDGNWRSHTYGTLDGAPTVANLQPPLGQTDLDVGKRNVFIFRDNELRSLEDRINTTAKISFLFDGPRGGVSNMFSWDSGFGAGSRQPPVLSVVFGPPQNGGEPLPTATPLPPTAPGVTCAQSLVTVLNRERVRAGVGVLAANELLARAADEHNRDLIINNFFSHIGSDGSTPQERVARAGYRASSVGQVLAAQSPDTEAVVAAWLSRAQRDEVLNPSYVDIGVSCLYAPRSTYGYYWTVDLARP